MNLSRPSSCLFPTLLLLALLGTCGRAQAATVNPPANDNLTDAIVLVPGSSQTNSHTVVGVNAVAATTEIDELNCGITTSWWYSITPEQSAHYFLSAFETNIGTAGDLTLGIYTGSNHPLTELTCIDEDAFSSGGESLTVFLTGGTTYFIRIGSKGTEDVPDIRTVVVRQSKTWEGAESSEWADPDNWKDGLVPLPGDNVLVREGLNSPIIATGEEVEIGNFTAASNGDFTLEAGGKLTLEGEGVGFSFSGRTGTIAGTMILTEGYDSGINANFGTLIITETGSVEVNGAPSNISNAFTLAGAMTINDSPTDGLLNLNTPPLTITETGTLNINNAASIGLYLLNPSVLQVDGELNITGTGGHGIVQESDSSIVIGPTGKLSIQETTTAALFMEDGGVTDNYGTISIAAADNGDAIIGGAFNNTASGILTADGTIQATTNFADGSRLEPGNSPGCLSFTNSVDLSSTTVAIEIEGTSVCTEYDQIIFEEGLDLTDATLELSGDYVPQFGEIFVIGSGGNTAPTGEFVGLPEGGTFEFNGAQMEITYAGGAGNDIILACITTVLYYWVGTEDTDWFNANNWDPVGVPEAQDMILISESSNDPVVAGGTALASFISMLPNTSLTVAENAVLRLEDDAASFITGSSGVITIDGELSITSSLPYGLSHNQGLLEVGSNGSMRLNGCGITAVDTLRVAGSIEINDARFDGLLIGQPESVTIVEESGSVMINQPGRNGIVLVGQLSVNGSLAIDQSAEAGVELDDTGELTVGELGAFSITNSGEDGIEASVAENPVDNNGLLALAGSGALVMNGGEIQNGANATLRADGAITATVTFAVGSRLEPGSSPGCLDFATAADLSGAVLSMEITGPTECIEYDATSFAAAIDISVTTLELSGDYIPELGDEFILLTQTTLDPLTGTFAGLPAGATLEFNGTILEIDYDQSSFIDEVILRAIAILPLDLLSFTGEAGDKKNILTWTTTNEEDFSHFTVERSVTGNNWEEIGRVVGDQGDLYEFEDDAQTAYYRLKMVDLDGAFAYSEVVLLERLLGGAAGAMKVFPNPSSGQFQLILPEHDGAINLALYTIHGTCVRAPKTVVATESWTVQEALPSGIYLIIATTEDGQRWTERVVVR